MNKQTIKLKIVLSGCCVFVLLGILIAGLSYRSNADFWGVGYDFGDYDSLVAIGEWQFEEAIDALDIDWLSGGATVLETTGDQVIVIEKAPQKGAEPLAKLSVQGNQLVIDSARQWRSFGFIFNNRIKDHYLEIYLPAKMYQSITLSGTSGDYLIETLETKELGVELLSGKVTLGNIKAERSEFEVASGQITASEIIGDQLEIDLTSGNIKIGGIFQDIDVDVTSGDAQISNRVLPKKFKAHVTSGGIALLIPENEGFAVHVDKVTGQFSGDFGYQMSNKMYRYKSGGPTFEVEMTSGHVTIDKLVEQLEQDL